MLRWDTYDGKGEIWIIGGGDGVACAVAHAAPPWTLAKSSDDARRELRSHFHVAAKMDPSLFNPSNPRRGGGTYS
jgi:hypothetical protein